MIIDALSNLKGYSFIHPDLNKVIDFIENLNLDNLILRRISIDNDDIFAILSESPLREDKDALLEVHNKYIDIQIPISKSEVFGWKSRGKLKQPTGTFDETKDIQFFDDKYELQFELKPDNFIVFFPNDAHAPCIGEGNVTKIVIKLKIK